MTPGSTARFDCERVARTLWDYLDGELSAEEAEAIRAHLEACEGCRGHADFEGRLVKELSELRGGDGARAGLMERVREALRAAAGESDSGRSDEGSP